MLTQRHVGYVFPDAPSISPYLELSQIGPTSQFCAELAKKLGCYVIAGYPEALSPDEPRSVIVRENYQHPEVGANSAVLYGPNGVFVGNYRKTNPFETDMTWAKPGNLFSQNQFSCQQYRVCCTDICCTRDWICHL